MRKLGWFLAAFGLMVLSACVTINVYFPAAEAQEAAREFVEKVIGDELPGGQTPAPAPAPTPAPAAAPASAPDAEAPAPRLIAAVAANPTDHPLQQTSRRYSVHHSFYKCRCCRNKCAYSEQRDIYVKLRIQMLFTIECSYHLSCTCVSFLFLFICAFSYYLCKPI